MKSSVGTDSTVRLETQLVVPVVAALWASTLSNSTSPVVSSSEQQHITSGQQQQQQQQPTLQTLHMTSCNQEQIQLGKLGKENEVTN